MVFSLVSVSGYSLSNWGNYSNESSELSSYVPKLSKAVPDSNQEIDQKIGKILSHLQKRKSIREKSAKTLGLVLSGSKSQFHVEVPEFPISKRFSEVTAVLSEVTDDPANASFSYTASKNKHDDEEIPTFFLDSSKKNENSGHGNEVESREIVTKENRVFPNLKGTWGFLNTSSAFLPGEKPTWGVGTGVSYQRYKFLNETPRVISGSQLVFPLNIIFSNNKFSSGFSLPYQSWKVTSYQFQTQPVKLAWYHDSGIRFGFQTWKSKSSDRAFLVHAAGRFPNHAYHQPLSFFEGKNRISPTRIGPKNIGPAGATKGAWLEAGGTYSWDYKSRWGTHLNLAFARDAVDKISRTIYSGAFHYNFSRSLTWIGEISGETWDTEKEVDGSNIDFQLGLAQRKGDFQVTFGVPISLAHEFGFGHDLGFNFGLSKIW